MIISKLVTFISARILEVFTFSMPLSIQEQPEKAIKAAKFKYAKNWNILEVL